MASDSSGGFFKTLEVVGIIVGALVAAFGFLRYLFQASLIEILVYVIIAASIFIALLVSLFLRKVGVIKAPTGEKGDSLGGEALTFSLPIYSRAVRPSITTGFREILNKNRQREISEIKQHLSGGKRGLIITGVKGVGKSTLAAYFAEGDDFWLDFVGKTIDLKTLMIILAQWVGEKDFEGHLQQCAKVGENEINHLCEKLSGLKRKLFFDNLETLLDKETRQFKDNGVSLLFHKLLKTAHTCRVLITSRIMPVLNEGRELEDEEGVVKVKSGGLSDKDGAELLREGGVEETEESPLESISREVDGNPLLLKQLIPIVRRPSVGGSLNKLKQWKEKYKGEILEAILKEEATEAGRDLIFRMSVVADPLPIEQVRVLHNKKNTDNVVDDLVGRSLLEWDKERKLFWLHPAVKETAAGEMERKLRLLKSARRSAVKMYLEIAKDIKPWEEWKSIEDCITVIRVAELMINFGNFEIACSTTMILHDSLYRWGHWHLLELLYEGLLFRWDSKPSRSNELLKIYVEILNNYGALKQSLGDFSKAIDLHSTQLEISTHIGDRYSECRAYGNIGNAECSLGNYTKAVEYHEKCLIFAQEISYREGEGNAYGNLGNTYGCLGDYKKAINYHEKSLEIDIELKNTRDIACDQGNLGNAYFSLGNFARAIEYYKKALLTAQEIDDRIGESNSYSGLGNAYFFLGEYDKAIDFHCKHLYLAKKIGDRCGEGAAYGNIGNVFEVLGDDNKAIDYYYKQLSIAKETGSRYSEGKALYGLGIANSNKDDHIKALDYIHRSLIIKKEIGDVHGVALCYGRIADEELYFDHNAAAAASAVQGLLIASEIGVPQARWLASITRECREKLGAEEFRRVTIEAVGEEKAEEVERILAEVEEGEESDG